MAFNSSRTALSCRRRFAPAPHLVAKKSDSGSRIEREYTGGQFDPDEFELVEGRWDHQHCIVSNFKIMAGYTYWQSDDGPIACDVCHQHIQSAQSDAAG